MAAIKRKVIKVSEAAYNAAVDIKNANPDKYSSRGLTGVFDDVFLHKFSTPGKGNRQKKKC